MPISAASGKCLDSETAPPADVAFGNAALRLWALLALAAESVPSFAALSLSASVGDLCTQNLRVAKLLCDAFICGQLRECKWAW